MLQAIKTQSCYIVFNNILLFVITSPGKLSIMVSRPIKGYLTALGGILLEKSKLAAFSQFGFRFCEKNFKSKPQLQCESARSAFDKPSFTPQVALTSLAVL